MSGFLSGVFTMSLTYPIDVIRVRLSVDMTQKY